MSKLLISTEASTTVFPPMNSYYNSLRKVTVSSNQTSSKLLILIFILEVAILAMVHVSFESTNSLIILTSIEGLIILLSLIFCLVYRTKSRITQYLQKFNDVIISVLVFALYLFKIEIFLKIQATRFVSLVGGMTLLPCILLADKCLVQLWHKLVLIGACFVYITARMAASEETDYVVSLQIALVFISSAYFLKRREETVQSLFSQVYCSYQKESSWHSIFRDFPEPIYLLNPDVKVAFTNVPCVENTKVAHEDTEKAMISNLESARNAGNSTDPFRYIQELELISDPELAFQFFKPLCFTGVNGIDDSAGDFLDDKDAQSARKSSRGIMSSPKGFRFSWKNDSGSLGHIQPIRTPTETMKAWLKGQNLVQLLEVLCKNTKRFYDFYRKAPIVLSGKVIEETTALLSPLRSTRDRAKDISGFKAVEVRLSVVNFQQEMNVLVMVTEKTIINPPSSLQSINEYKINLLASFSHELRNPLNGNLNFLETAIQRPDLPEDIKTDYLVPAWTSATLLLYIVNDILDYSQFSLNKIVLRIKSSKISCLLEDIVELFKIQFAKKNLKITLDYPANDEIATDHTRLSQILVNLVSNALKFTEEGGVHVTVVKTTEPPNCYKISVSDTGIGLAPKQRKKIERILKGEDSEKVDSKSVGSNLGLTTSGRLAVLLGPAKGNGITIEPVKKGTKLVFLIENKQQAQEKSLLDLSLSGLIGNSSPQMMDGSFRSDCPVEQPQQVTLQLKRDDLRKFTLRKSASSNDIQEAANEYKSKFSNDSQALMFTMPEEGRAAIVEKKSLTSGMVRVKGTHTGTTTTGIFSNSGKKMSMKMNSYKEPKCRCNFILIVDDDSFNVMAAEKMFSAVNLTPVSAFHGKQAIQVLESRQKCSETCQLFKFILMDCNMPVMDGYDATRYLKKKMKSGALPYIPIVGCTAFVTYFDAAKCFDSGMDDYVTKPLGKEKMTRILEKWVRNRPLVQGPAFNM